MQLIRKVGGGLFAGFRYDVTTGKIAPRWSQVEEGSATAMVFLPAVPQSTIDDLNKSGDEYTVLTFSS